MARAGREGNVDIAISPPARQTTHALRASSSSSTSGARALPAQALLVKLVGAVPPARQAHRQPQALVDLDHERALQSGYGFAVDGDEWERPGWGGGGGPRGRWVDVQRADWEGQQRASVAQRWACGGSKRWTLVVERRGLVDVAAVVGRRDGRQERRARDLRVGPGWVQRRAWKGGVRDGPPTDLLLDGNVEEAVAWVREGPLDEVPGERDERASRSARRVRAAEPGERGAHRSATGVRPALRERRRAGGQCQDLGKERRARTH